jgi:hypothetical protein
MHYSGMIRHYDAKIKTKVKNPELKNFNLNIPITCTASTD